MAASAKSSVPNTWEGVIAAARSAGAAYPELVAAQWALESGWGKHTSGKHNYFGLKGEGTKTQTTEYVKGKPLQVEAAFLDFGGLGECIQYLVDRWYRDWKGYRGVNQASTLELAAKELVKQGYATDPKADSAGGRSEGDGEGG
jgi:flagellum-specific peptidoglycan hydrolase FlgJ